MIPVTPQDPPDDFEERVGHKGRAFLASTPHPKSWKNREYWQDIIPDLRQRYQSICAYCCHWISLDTGAASVDHFVPKSIAPERAYDWTNFRLASMKLNSKKGDAQDVLDPFSLKQETFILLFPAMLVKPNANLSDADREAAWATIQRLQLNDDEQLVKARFEWAAGFAIGDYTFQHLQRRVPFIADEIARQNLFDVLPRMFQLRQ